MSAADYTLSRSYEGRLRVIGGQIEAQAIRDIALFEIDGGFILRGARGVLQQAEAFEFPDEQFPWLTQSAHDARGKGDSRSYRPPLLPTGYEDFLRAVGCVFDGMLAKSVMICELETAFVIAGLEPVDGPQGRITYQKFERFLGAGDIRAALDEAFQRRSSGGGFLARRAKLHALRG